jgi:hypothetical protein
VREKFVGVYGFAENATLFESIGHVGYVRGRVARDKHGRYRPPSHLSELADCLNTGGTWTEMKIADNEIRCG